MKTTSTYKPLIYLSPILLLYIAIVLLFGAKAPLGDGIRFWAYAGNILQGSYATAEVGMLHMGPGYPLLLSIFRGLGTPILIPLLLNAFLLFFACYFLFKTLTQYISFKTALVIIYLFAIWDPFLLYWTQKLYSEPLVVFLICFGMYSLLNYYNSSTKKHLYFTAATLGYLALTKVIFGYVLAAFLIISLFIFLFKIEKQIFKKNILVSALALLFCLPYLAYTYKQTGKLFYWGNTGGELLYWTASPHQTDLGEWHSASIGMNDFFAERYHLSGVDPDLVYKVNEIITSRIYEDHKPFKEKLNGLGAYAADSLYKQEAIKNIKAYPTLFLKNWVMNLGRITLGYPHALFVKPPFSPFMSLLNIVKSSFGVILFLISLFVSFINYKKLRNTKELSLLLLGLIYIGGTSLLAAQSQRFMIPFTPIMLFWTVFVLRNFKLKF